MEIQNFLDEYLQYSLKEQEMIQKLNLMATKIYSILRKNRGKIKWSWFNSLMFTLS